VSLGNKLKQPVLPEAEIFLPDAAATSAAGHDLGRRLAEASRRGALPFSFLLTLSGDLGAGKTTFCQGLGLGLGTEDPAAIVSPTFTLANEYPGLVDIFHLDLYRLDSPREFAEAGLEDYLVRPGLTVVEWPEKMPPDFWPAGRLALSLAFQGEGRLLRVISGLP
jgi:tRNA threonylcarbamoyladenosine biosynthesis protein TsaE